MTLKGARAVGIALAALAATWQIVASWHSRVLSVIWDVAGFTPPVPNWRFLSSPVEVLRSLPREVASGALSGAVWETGWHTVAATSIAFAVGTALAELLVSRPGISRSVFPIIRAFNGIPPVTLLPAFLVAFGLEAKSVVAMAAFGATFSVAAVVHEGSMRQPVDLSTLLEKLGYSPLGSWLWRLSCMEPYLLVALREAVRWSLILSVVAEMHGAVAGGIGAYVDSGRLNQQYAIVYAGVAGCGVLSFVLQRLFDFALRRGHRLAVGWLLNA